MVRLLTDADVEAHASPERCTAWMREAVVAEHQGRLVAPPRVQVALGDRRLVYTAGSLAAEWYGYRSYTAPGLDGDDQVVVVHDAESGRVVGLHVGTAIGPRRVGGIGAVALEALARPDASMLAVVGTGNQAWHQVWAAAATRRLATVAVHSRDASRREAFAARVESELGVPATASPSAREAVEDADLVVLATSSSVPVIEASWLRAGAYLTTVGPKQVDRHEFGLDLAERATVLVTDSLRQLRAYDPPHLLEGTPHDGRIAELGAVVTGDHALPDAPDLTMFLSVGLAGTEAHLLHRLLGHV
jgi:ornithine cyclodeaminase